MPWEKACPSVPIQAANMGKRPHGLLLDLLTGQPHPRGAKAARPAPGALALVATACPGTLDRLHPACMMAVWRGAKKCHQSVTRVSPAPKRGWGMDARAVE